MPVGAAPGGGGTDTPDPPRNRAPGDGDGITGGGHGGEPPLLRLRQWLAVGRRRWILPGTVVAVAAGGAVLAGLALGSALFSSEQRAAKPRDAPLGFTRVRRAGISVAYPTSWVPLKPVAPQAVLIAGTPDATGSVQVRVDPLNFEATRRRRDLARLYTLKRVALGGRNVRLETGPKRITVGRLYGYFYFYSFRHRRTGLRGTHDHYFLFDGRRVISFIFQALPAGTLPRHDRAFDQILATFRDETR